MTAASSGSMSSHSPLSFSLKRLSAESGRQVLSAWLTASNAACAPACSAGTELAGTSLPRPSRTVQALPMVSPCSVGRYGMPAAQPPSASAVTPSSSRVKLLRQDFKRRVVGRGALLHAGHRRVLVLDLGVDPVEAGGRPGHGDHAVRIGLELERGRRIAITRAAGDDLHRQVLRR